MKDIKLTAAEEKNQINQNLNQNSQPRLIEVNFKEQINLLAGKYSHQSPNRPRTESSAKGTSTQSRASHNYIDLELQSAKCVLDLSMTSTISTDDSSDNDEKAKELLAKWGDKKYQANLRNYSDLSNSKLKLSLSLDSSEQSSTESEPENNSTSKPSTVRPNRVVMQSVKEPLAIAENSKLNAPNASRKNLIIPSPDKSLLSSECIREIIQQDIIEKEKTKKARTDKSKSGEAYEQKGTCASHALYGKHASSTIKGGENVNSSSMQSTYSKPDYGGMENTEQKTKLELGVKEGSKSFSKVSSRVEFVVPLENKDRKVKGTQSKQHIAGESELLKKIRGLGASIREAKKERFTEGDARLASEKGSATSTDKQQVESSTSKSATSVLLDTEQSADANEKIKSYGKEGHGNEKDTMRRNGKAEAEKQMSPQGKSQHSTASEVKAAHPGKEVPPQEKRKTVIDKSNLVRLKGIIKGAMKAKGSEHGNDGRDVVEVEPNELETTDVAGERESTDKVISSNRDFHSGENFCENQKKTEVTPKEDFNTEGMRKDDDMQKKTAGVSSRVEGGKPQDYLAVGAGSNQSGEQSIGSEGNDDCSTQTGTQDSKPSASEVQQMEAKETGLESKSTGELGCEDVLLRTTTLQRRTKKALKGERRADSEERAGNERDMRVKDASEVDKSLEAKRSTLMKRGSTGIAETIEAKVLETKKKAKMQRNENERQQNNETSSPAKGDIIGGILRRSSMTKSIDERVSIGNENR